MSRLALLLRLPGVFPFCLLLACGEAHTKVRPPGGDSGIGGAGGEPETGQSSSSGGAATTGSAGSSVQSDSGAGAGGGPDSTPAICDGSKELRFAAGIPWNGPTAYGGGLLYELGVTVILVGGDCRFYVWGKDPALTPYGSWSGTRTGTLNATDARDLADDFGYATWPDMAGVYGPDAAVSDFPRFYLFDGEHQVICNTPCDKSAPSVAAAFERTSAWVTRLYDLGNDSDGPLRLRVYEAEDFLSDPLPEWPLAKPAADLTTMPQADPNLIWGPAIELTEAADTAALRGLREQLARRLVQDEPAQARHAAPGMQYLYAFRDSTPFEDSDGNLKGLYEQP